MTLLNSVENRKAETLELAHNIQAELMRRQHALLRIPEVYFRVVSDLTLGLSADQNSFVNILASIRVDGAWVPVNQLSHEQLVAEVGGLVDQLSVAYEGSINDRISALEDRGVTSFAKRQASHVFGAIQLNDYYLKEFFPLRDSLVKVSEGLSESDIGLSAEEASSALLDLDESQKSLKFLIEKMMVLNEPAFKDIIRPYMTGSFDRDDLLAEANDGFYRACIKFNPQAGANFYAVLKRWVVARVVAFIDRQSSILSVGSNSGSLYRKIRSARKELGGDGKVVRMTDVAKRVGLSVDAVLTCETSFGSWGGANDEARLLSIESGHQTPEDAAELRDNQAIVAELLGHLSAREAQIIAGRYGIGCSPKTLEELGETYGVSCEAIRQTQRKAERKMAEIAKGLV